MANKRIKDEMKRSGVYTWQLADALGVSENTLYRRMRHELPQMEQDRIISLIKSHFGKEG